MSVVSEEIKASSQELLIKLTESMRDLVILAKAACTMADVGVEGMTAEKTLQPFINEVGKWLHDYKVSTNGCSPSDELRNYRKQLLTMTESHVATVMQLNQDNKAVLQHIKILEFKPDLVSILETEGIRDDDYGFDDQFPSIESLQSKIATSMQETEGQFLEKIYHYPTERLIFNFKAISGDESKFDKSEPKEEISFDQINKPIARVVVHVTSCVSGMIFFDQNGAEMARIGEFSNQEQFFTKEITIPQDQRIVGIRFKRASNDQFLENLAFILLRSPQFIVGVSHTE